MSKIIIYGSKYGTTKHYAEEMSKKTGIPCTDSRKRKTLAGYDSIIHIGGLYAGSVLGLPQTVKLLPASPEATLTIITVGLADPEDEANKQGIHNFIKKQIPGDIYEKTDIYHLRGGIDYPQLTILHKIMMSFLHNKMKKTPPQQRNAETKAFLDTYGKKVDFTDLNRLDEIIKTINTK